MTTPLWRVLRHGGDSGYYWRLLWEGHGEDSARERLEKVRAKMLEGGVRLTKETVEFEGWERGGNPKLKGGGAGGLDMVTRPREKGTCPGCGESTSFDKGHVCDGCAELLKLAREAQHKAEKRKGLLYSVTQYCPSFHAESGNGHHYVRSEVGKALGNAVMALGIPAPADRGDKIQQLFKRDLDDRDDTRGTILELGKEGADACRELYAEIQDAIQAAFDDGYQQGQNLLFQLASGEVSVKDLNDEAVKATEQKQPKKRKGKR